MLLNEQAKTTGAGRPAGPRIDVKRHLLDWAIKRSGKSVKSLARNDSLKKIDAWLSGETKPTLRQMKIFANATFTPLGYLFLSEPPAEEPVIPYFRTAGGDPAPRPSPNLAETIHIIKQRQDWMRERLIDYGNDKLRYVGSARPADPPAEVASEMRNEMGMAGEWAAGVKSRTYALGVLRDRMEDIGVFVATSGIVGFNTRRMLQVKEFRGFVLVDDYAPFVFVNGADAKAAQLFTLAHELAHVWLGKSAAFDLHMLAPANDPIELACNRIAAEFLVPEADMRRIWDKAGNRPAQYRRISKDFKVSEIVVARRALDLGLVDQNAFDNFYKKQYEADVRSGRGGGNFYTNANLRIGQSFGRSVVTAVRQGEILYREAHRLTGMNHASFNRYAIQVDGE